MKREDIVKRLADIGGILENMAASEAGYSEEQVTEIESLNGEFEALSKQLETLDKVEGMKTKSAASAGRKTGSQTPATTTRVDVGASASDRFGGFKSGGDFLMAVKKAGATGEVDARFKNTAYEKNGEDGGFLVPDEVAAGILKKLDSNESLMSATTQVPVSGSTLTANVDESQPWNQGIQAYWTAEGAQIQNTKASFKQASWRLHKVAALVPATDELLEDATALEGYINAAAPAAIMHKINNAIISGNGVGKPSGIIASPYTVTVSKESGQAADTIVARNIIKMFSRMIPSMRAGASWYINAGCEEQLYMMKDDVGNFIYLAPGSQMNQSPYGLLLGRPVIPLMSGIPGIGDVGDIIFANLSSYWMIRKASGVKASTSIHLQFDRDITNFKFTMRVDGKCPFTSPVTTEFGSYQMSSFVQLEAR